MKKEEKPSWTTEKERGRNLEGVWDEVRMGKMRAKWGWRREDSKDLPTHKKETEKEERNGVKTGENILY